MPHLRRNVPPNGTTNTKGAAQGNDAGVVFNRGTHAGGPRPTARGEDRIQKGKGFMPDWTIPEMEEYMGGLKDGKEKTVVLACIKRKESKTIARIAGELRKPPDTVRGWLARGRERGLYGLADRKPPGNAPALDHSMAETIRGWMSKSPREFGYKRRRWQCRMVRDMIRKDLGIPCSGDTVRRMMHHMGFSFRKSRPATRKAASEGEQKEFRAAAAARLGVLAALGYVILALDEASCLVGGWNGYGWLPVGGRETIPMSWSKKSVRLIGVLGEGWFHIAIVESANSKTLRSFLNRVRESVGNVAAVMDNVSYHKSQDMDEYERDSGGGLVRIFLPKYTPQLNPIEVLWRDLKRALAGGYFDSMDELKAAILEIVEGGELHPPKLMDYMLPGGAGRPARISCKIWDMTSEACGPAAAA